MSSFTFLPQKRYFGSVKLDIFKVRETKAVITDFAILLGGWVERDIGDYYLHIDSDDSLEGRCGCYWTSSDGRDEDGRSIRDEHVMSFYKDDSMLLDNDARVILDEHFSFRHDVLLRDGGARPALSFSSIFNIPKNRVSGALKRVKNGALGVFEVEYGYYPQNAVSRDMQEKLEMAFQRRSLSRTGMKYTTDSRKFNEYYAEFSPQQHEEFQLDGKRYVRVKANSCFDGAEFKLSNGESYRDGDHVWVEVAPVKWLVDERAKIMITEKIIFAGVQFNHTRDYHTEDFDRTDIKRFMDIYLSKELEESSRESDNSNRAQSASSKVEQIEDMFRGEQVINITDGEEPDDK